MRTLAFLFLSLLPSARAESWTQFRGPDGHGHATAQGLPVTFGEKEALAWKTPVPHRGWSTPLVHGSQVWVTTATEDGHDFFVYALDRATGKVLHEKKLFHSEAPEPLGNALNGYASCTGVIEDGAVYVHFGSYGTACLDTTTFQEKWRRTDLPCRHYRGPGSSVLAWKDTLILTMDGVDVQYLCALDKKTGATRWKTDRNTDFGDLGPDGKPTAEGDYRKAYSTPLPIKVGESWQIVSTGSKATVAYDPADGREIWRVRYKGFSNATLPAWHDGTLTINTGHGGKTTWLAYLIKPETKGDITDAIAWEQQKAVPTRSSAVVVDGILHQNADNGIISAMSMTDGELFFQERTAGNASGSPILADGRLYFANEKGEVTVTKPGRTFEKLAVNQLDDGIMASPVAAGRDLVIRTKSHVYLFRK
jgi:outer membrane protein assembly factor BamB